MQAHRRASLLLAASLLLTSGCALVTALGEDAEEQDGADMAVTPDMSGMPDLPVGPDMPGLPDMPNPDTLYPTLNDCKAKCEQPGAAGLCVADGAGYRCATSEIVHDRCVRAVNLTVEAKVGGVHAAVAPNALAVLVQDGGRVEALLFTGLGEPDRLTTPGYTDRIRSIHILDAGVFTAITEAPSGASSAYNLVTIRKGMSSLPVFDTLPLRIAQPGAPRGLIPCDVNGQRIFAVPYKSGGARRLAALFCDKADAVDRWYVGGFTEVSGPAGFTGTLDSDYFSMFSEQRHVGAAMRSSSNGPDGVATTTRLLPSLHELRVYLFNPNQPPMMSMPPVIELSQMTNMPRVLSLPPSGADPAGCPLDRMANDQPPVTWFDEGSSPARLFVASAGPAGYAVSAAPGGGDRLVSQSCTQSATPHTLRAGTFAPAAMASALLMERGEQDVELVVELINSRGATASTILRPVPGRYERLRAYSILADPRRTTVVASRSEGANQQLIIMELNAEGRPICN